MEENWDNADSPAYIPKTENKRIIHKTPAKLTKAQKKQFYEEERQRWAKLNQNSKVKVKSWGGSEATKQKTIFIVPMTLYKQWR